MQQKMLNTLLFFLSKIFAHKYRIHMLHTYARIRIQRAYCFLCLRRERNTQNIPFLFIFIICDFALRSCRTAYNARTTFTYMFQECNCNCSRVVWVGRSVLLSPVTTCRLTAIPRFAYCFSLCQCVMHVRLVVCARVEYTTSPHHIYQC